MSFNSDYLGRLLAGYITSVVLVAVIILILAIIAEWKIFKKAGKKGWECIVPFYYEYISYQLYWGNGWLFLVPYVCVFLGNVLPFIGIAFSLFLLVFACLHAHKKALAFGESIGFTIGLIFLPTIFDMILAFGKYEYKGVPIDGTSYKELKSKYDDVSEKVKEKESKTVFEQPEDEKKPDVEYDKPIDAEFVPKEEDKK